MSSLIAPFTPQAEPTLRLRDNPLLVAQARRRLRRKERLTTIAVVSILCVCALMFTGALSLGAKAWGYTADVMLLFLGVAVLLGGTSAVAGTMAEERATGILDFHRATPTTPWTDALGYLVGCVAREYLIAAIIAPFMVACALMGGRSIADVLTWLVCIGMTGLLYHAFGLLAGFAGDKRRRTATAMGFMVLALAALAHYAAGLGLSAVAYLSPVPVLISANWFESGRLLGTYLPELFGVSIPPILYALLVQGVVFAFLFQASARKLRDEALPAFSRPGAIGFFAIATVLFVGGAWSTLAGGGVVARVIGQRLSVSAVATAYLICGTAVAAALLASLAPTWLAFARAWRGARKRDLSQPPWLEDGARPWLLVPVFSGILVSGLVLVWTGARATLGSGTLTGAGSLLAMVGIVAVLAFVCGATQYLQFEFRRSYKTGVLLIGFLTCILPWILGGIVGASGARDLASYVTALSPLYAAGAAAVLLGTEWGGGTAPTDAPSIIVSLLVTAAMTAFFVQRVEAAAAKLAVDWDADATRKGA